MCRIPPNPLDQSPSKLAILRRGCQFPRRFLDSAMPFSVATWNINSVRLRMPLVERFLLENAPDVLCLQETKCPDDQFPSAAFRKVGYQHVAISGQKGYHGVAIVARRPIDVVEKRRFCDIDDCRHISVR